MWSALPVGDSYGDIVKLLLLTGQRRQKVWAMRWDDISIDGTWSVPNGMREKGAGGELVLPEMAVDIIRNRPRFEFNPTSSLVAVLDASPVFTSHATSLKPARHPRSGHQLDAARPPPDRAQPNESRWIRPILLSGF